MTLWDPVVLPCLLEGHRAMIVTKNEVGLQKHTSRIRFSAS